METSKTTATVETKDLTESENDLILQQKDEASSNQKNEAPSNQKETFLSRLFTKRRYSIFYIIFGVGGLLILVLIHNQSSESFSKDFKVETILLISSLLLIHGIADVFSKDELLDEMLKKTRESLLPTEARINEINSKIQEIGNEKYLSSLKPLIQSQIKKSLQNVITVYELMNAENLRNNGFETIANKLLKNEEKILEELSQGKIEVPSEQTVYIQRMLSETYSSRFDAVSKNDLNFWLAPEQSSAYLKLNENSIDKRGTIITRIFIISLADIKLRASDIANVISEHGKIGIGWGIVIEEQIDDINHNGLSLDFALFDKEKAVSIFRLRNNRAYEAIFLTKANASKINDYRKNHRNLIVECLIVNDIFKEHYKGSLSSTENDEISNLLAQKQKKFIQKYQLSDIGNDEHSFLKTANKSDEIKAALIFIDGLFSKNNPKSS